MDFNEKDLNKLRERHSKTVTMLQEESVDRPVVPIEFAKILVDKKISSREVA